MGKKVGGIAVDRDSTRFAQNWFGGSATEKRNRCQARFSGGFDVEPRVADRDRFRRPYLQLFERRAENVGCGFGMIGVIRGGVAFDEVFDFKELYVILGVSFFPGAGENDPFVVVSDSLKKFAHF